MFIKTCNCKACKGTGKIKSERQEQRHKNYIKTIKSERKNGVPLKEIKEEIKELEASIPKNFFYEQCPFCEKSFYSSEWRDFVRLKDEIKISKGITESSKIIREIQKITL